MQGLNDFDEQVTEKTFLPELLNLLDVNFHQSFYGFYLNFIKVNLVRLKTQNKVSKNLIELLKIILKVIFIYFLVKLVAKLLHQVNFEFASFKYR
jgi:hypothetical protein